MSKDLDLDDVASVSPTATRELYELRQQLNEQSAIITRQLCERDELRQQVTMLSNFIPDDLAGAVLCHAEPSWYHHTEEGQDVFINMPFGLPDETPLYHALEPKP